MWNGQKIKQPQTASLENYNIEKDGDKYVLGWCFHFNLHKYLYGGIGGFKQSQGLILVKSEYDFGKVGVWIW